MKYNNLPTTHTDAFLIGAGIMSTTLASLLNQLYPEWKIQIAERAEHGGLESSASLNNAGTGHAGYCEMNYTPEINGEIDTTKAVKVNKAFQRSLDYWQYLVYIGSIKGDFSLYVPHVTFVHGAENVAFLRKRWSAMLRHKAFKKIIFTEDPEIIRTWIPLVMDGRPANEPVAATRMVTGADIDFGKLTKYLIEHLTNKGIYIRGNTEVIDLFKEDGKWNIIKKDLTTKKLSRVISNFVFIGAGGASITLLEKSGIPEGKGYGGFPVSGEWLICDNQAIVKQHEAKVYGRPSVGSPPMSVPHLDTRIIDGKRCLLFGPYAGCSTKFLKNGSWTDFFKSIRLGNIGVMLDAGLRNIPLTKYLMKELFKTSAGRFKVLKDYYPNAMEQHWKPAVAGQRVQIMKKVNGIGVIEFGTEVVSSADGSLACLLGASPGASTSVDIMLGLIEKCFDIDDDVQNKLMEMIPSYIEKIPCIS